MNAARQPKIWKARASLHDPKAFETLLKPISQADEVRKRIKLHEPIGVRVYDIESQADFWLSSDGEMVSRWTLAGLTAEQAADVRIAFDQRAADTGQPLQSTWIKSIVAKVMCAPRSRPS